MNSRIKFISVGLLSVIIIGCSIKKEKISNEKVISCNKMNSNGVVIRKDKGYHYTLIDSTNLFVYVDTVYTSPFAPGTRLYYVARHKKVAGYFSQSRCSKLYNLNYNNIKKLYKNTLPDFVNEVKKEYNEDSLIVIDESNKISRINLILKKYQKS